MTTAGAARVRPDGFAQLIYQMLVVEKLAPVGQVADALRLTPSALYGRMHGRSRFRLEEVRALIVLLDDQRLLRWFCDDSRYVVARRPAGDAAGQAVLPATVDALHGAIDLMKIVVSALEDGPRLDHRDRAAILKEVKEAETAIANLRAAVEHTAG